VAEVFVGGAVGVSDDHSAAVLGRGEGARDDLGAEADQQLTGRGEVAGGEGGGDIREPVGFQLGGGEKERFYRGEFRAGEAESMCR
jgi:hypothetical protein